jgi:Flp pilus assembly protein TadD
MILGWLNGREAIQAGAALAEEFTSASAAHGKTGARDLDCAVRAVLQRVDREVRALRLNFYKRARFANSFKWRLIEKGVESKLADQVTESVVLHLSVNQNLAANRMTAVAPRLRDAAKVQRLLDEGKDFFARGDYRKALACSGELTSLDPHNVAAINNIGSALWKLDRFVEAEQNFRDAVSLNANYPEALSNLGNVLRARGQFGEAEMYLRLALKLKPKDLQVQSDLASTLLMTGRLEDAQARFDKVLKTAPRRTDALCGMGQIAAIDGRFDEAETLYGSALQIDPQLVTAHAPLAGLRKMTSSDGAWLKRAEELRANRLPPLDEAKLRFAMGKYCDDVGDFDRAFKNFRCANELMKPLAEPYSKDERVQFVDDVIRTHTRASISQVKDGGCSSSATPIFVVGMPRSGTSLAEQIIGSHPLAKGVGELSFWNEIGLEHEAAIRRGPLDEPLRNKLATRYLRILRDRAAHAARVVDKAPVNCDYLGVIRSVFPNARIIYMLRDPIDTCLSCYFQQLPLTLNYTLDLWDLTHYYRQHERLMAHWRAVLPPGTILDLPYAELVADQEGWTRKMLDFLGLEWDERCLNFHLTKRSVLTASFWQVRQKIYKDSVARWRNYEKFIAPLLKLQSG